MPRDRRRLLLREAERLLRLLPALAYSDNGVIAPKTQEPARLMASVTAFDSGDEMEERVGESSTESGIMDEGRRGVALGEVGSDDKGERAVEDPDTSLLCPPANMEYGPRSNCAVFVSRSWVKRGRRTSYRPKTNLLPRSPLPCPFFLKTYIFKPTIAATMQVTYINRIPQTPRNVHSHASSECHELP